jgi:hypothetical protein
VETPRKFITANLRGVSTNKTIIYFIAMQTYKELNKRFIKSMFNAWYSIYALSSLTSLPVS